jgi:hypothetical protein
MKPAAPVTSVMPLYSMLDSFAGGAWRGGFVAGLLDFRAGAAEPGEHHFVEVDPQLGGQADVPIAPLPFGNELFSDAELLLVITIWSCSPATNGHCRPPRKSETQ